MTNHHYMIIGEFSSFINMQLDVFLFSFSVQYTKEKWGKLNQSMYYWFLDQSCISCWDLYYVGNS